MNNLYTLVSSFINANPEITKRCPHIFLTFCEHEERSPNRTKWTPDDKKFTIDWVPKLVNEIIFTDDYLEPFMNWRYDHIMAPHYFDISKGLEQLSQLQQIEYQVIRTETKICTWHNYFFDNTLYLGLPEKFDGFTQLLGTFIYVFEDSNKKLGGWGFDTKGVFESETEDIMCIGRKRLEQLIENNLNFARKQLCMPDGSIAELADRIGCIASIKDGFYHGLYYQDGAYHPE